MLYCPEPPTHDSEISIHDSPITMLELDANNRYRGASRRPPCSNLFALLLSSPLFRLTACLILFVIWALIYLTNLGSSEFRSEEGHRVLPAVQMLDK